MNSVRILSVVVVLAAGLAVGELVIGQPALADPTPAAPVPLPSAAAGVTAQTVESLGKNLGKELSKDLTAQKDPPKPLTGSVLGQEPSLTPKQEAARNIAQEWQKVGQPMRGLDGSVVYVFGAGSPEVVCSPLNVCDIELEKGEQITSNFSIGDSARWLLQFIPGGDTTPPHVAVKPTDVGIETSLMIPTNQRTYHLHLVSDSKQYTALTKFVYPEEVLAQVKGQAQKEEIQRQRLTITPYTAGNVLTVDKLDFKYRITGKAPFTPVRVFNDGIHTIIQLPEEVRTAIAPVLLVSNRDAPSSAGPTAAVNYRLVDNRFIVDSLFHDAVLVSGVGSRAKLVHITRIGPNPEIPEVEPAEDR